MFTLHTLEKSSSKRNKRVGRGQGSNRGKNSGKGHKGQNKHGQGVRIGFEGGQKTLLRRTPKLRGFNARPRKDLATINADVIDSMFPKQEINLQTLIENKIVDHRVKTVRVYKGKKETLTFTVVSSDSIYLTKGVKIMLGQ